MSGDRRLPPVTIAGPAGRGESPATGPEVDPRAVRVGVTAATRLEGDPSLSVAPAPAGIAGSAAATLRGTLGAVSGDPLVDGIPTAASLRRFDATRGRLERADGAALRRTDVLFGRIEREPSRGTDVREVVVGGWRLVLEVEAERRAQLRERARRGAGAVALGGPVEVRAIIPGRVVAVSVAAGDAVEAGQQVLVVEAMKMENELRAPREGSVERVGVAVGDTIEIGDLLVVIR